jgi:hypothetical protein
MIRAALTRSREIDHADRNGDRHSRAPTDKWTEAGREAVSEHRPSGARSSVCAQGESELITGANSMAEQRQSRYLVSQQRTAGAITALGGNERMARKRAIRGQ